MNKTMKAHKEEEAQSSFDPAIWHCEETHIFHVSSVWDVPFS
jgi:hypothetical protein